jgi:hypothetical protein
VGWLVLLLVSLLGSGPALAQGTAMQRYQARKLAGEALDLYKAGDYEAALAKLREADGLVPAPTLRLHVARCLDRLNQMQKAAEAYREVIAFALNALAPRVHHDARRDAVAELAKLLEEMPTLTVVVTKAAGAAVEVQLDGKPFEPAMLGEKQPMDPGAYSFEARAGERVVRKRVTLERGEHQKLDLELPPPPVIPVLPLDEGGGTAMRIGGWVAVGVGGAGLLLGTIAGGVVLSREKGLLARCPDHKCPPEAHDDARSFDSLRAASTAGFVIAGVGAAVGTTLLLLAPPGARTEPEPSDEPDEDEVAMLPYVTFGGLGLKGTF